MTSSAQSATGRMLFVSRPVVSLLPLRPPTAGPSMGGRFVYTRLYTVYVDLPNGF